MNKANARAPFLLRSSISVALGLALAPGCATSLGHGIGFIDSRMAAAAQADTAKEAEIEIDAAGAITKLSVEQTDPAKLPEIVRKLVESTYPGATLTEYEQEVYADGALVHEVEAKTADGKECELSATDAGVLRYTECKLQPAELPSAVSQALAAAVPGAEIKEAEIRKSSAGEEYRIEAKAGARGYYLRFKTDGTLVAKMLRLEAELTIPVK